MDSKSGASILHLFLSWFETDLELIVSEKNLVLALAKAWRALCGAGVPPPMPLTLVGPTPMPLSHLSKNLEMPVIRHRLKAICLWTKCHLTLSSRVQPSPSLPPMGTSTQHTALLPPSRHTAHVLCFTCFSLTHDALTQTPSSQPSVKILLSSCSLFPVPLGSSFTFTKFKVI